MENITSPKFEAFHTALKGLEPFPTHVGELEVQLEVIREIEGLRFCYSVRKSFRWLDTVFSYRYCMDLIDPAIMRHSSGTSTCNSDPEYFEVVGLIYTHAAKVHKIFVETTA